MPQVTPEFSDFISRCCSALGLNEPTLTANSYLFRVKDRWVELKFVPSDRRVAFVSLIVLNTLTLAPRADLLASFNAYNLFHGGYSLITATDNKQAIYLYQAHRFDPLVLRDIRQHLEQFSERADKASLWYLRCFQSPDEVGIDAIGSDFRTHRL